MNGTARICLHNGDIRLAELHCYEAHGIGKKDSNASGTSTDRARRSASRLPKGARFVVCVNNEGYQASLERNKIYVALPDEEAELAGDIRVIDESEEDYLYAAKRFVATELPEAVQAPVRRAS